MDVVFDDQLTERLRCCTLCGRPPQWMEVFALGAVAVLATLCHRCVSTRGWDAVDVVLRERYAPPGAEAS